MSRLRRVGAGVVALALLGLVANYWLVSQRLALPDARHVAAHSVAFNALFNLSTSYAPAFPAARRGIALCLHTEIAAMGVSLIRELRSLGNTDPIQVYFCLPAELAPPVWTLLAEDPLVEIIDLCSLLVEAGHFQDVEAARAFQSFWLKPLALLFSSFDQVMLLDADDIFFENPSTLWASPSYTETGTLFFYDRVINTTAFSNSVVNVTLENGAVVPGRYITEFIKTFPLARFGRPPVHTPSAHLRASMLWRGHTAHEQDSSVVLINKVRAGPTVLKILHHLIRDSRFLDPPFSWGDKESFWLAFELGGKDYRFSPWACSVVSRPFDRLVDPNSLCGSLAQYAPLETSNATLLYINGQDIIQPFDSRGYGRPSWPDRLTTLLTAMPRHVAPRHRRGPVAAARGSLDESCLVAMGAEPLHHAAQLRQRIVWTIEAAQALDVAFRSGPTLQKSVKFQSSVVVGVFFGVLLVLLCVFYVTSSDR
ncbi:hypothetical protein SPRG_15650 [Saprolegnia parasitica CBS 223.65]|uniref:Nucleotide-diphospho-sugar transferase domain-containing protein n=1 Tax=Saprolegnia parasitica (strain CBS 223.65) TaxID=695850 RepID=A0A067BXE3_SAPPC|nr:hypothetical protein SPRG_15650 [Saprolegnia parasitica CBS 223.65]KDO19207.1 hypothetical protein SPRG_15650 [Saprolegnia parasitica CBS 223.65]|eukprot:XP_012210073.1 hypothetical protein SPRG_15650 [Saprolegnia parasitica CBS 223.65]